MIFEELVLHNFGIYKGRHVLKLTPPSPKKNIILLGGLNGSGKTTLLDALQLTLYGKFAKYSNRGHINYFDYLARMINYHVDPSNGASLELQFKHFKQGKEESIRLHRSWYLNGKNIKETVEVKRDGVLDSVITDHWYEYIEEFIPAQISNLFFFDGEKIEAFADQNKAAELLKTGIHALLGLDLVDRLSTDLLTVERKRKTRLQSQQDKSDLIDLEEKITQLEEQAQLITQQKTQTQDRLKELEQEQKKWREAYRREGGELFEQRATIETQLKVAQEKRVHIEDQLRELAASEAPLLMVENLLKETEKQAIREKEAQETRLLHDTLKERDAALFQLLKQYEIKPSALLAIENWIKTEQLKHQKAIKTKCYLNITVDSFTKLQKNFFNQIIIKIKPLIADREDIIEAINRYERQLVSIPDPERLEGITQELNNTKKEITKTQLQLAHLEQEYKRIGKEIARKKTEVTQTYEMEAQEQFAHEISYRVLQHSEKVRHTLKKFGRIVTKKYIRQLETLILDSFQQLIRKNNFISQIEIEPTHYNLTLYTPTHEKLPANILSAGERQLLAVSILWGLSRASGRPLPAIIDTPLSRLDGKHRHNLVENYFHQASHQVILLSTDEEINEKYHHHLKPAVGREYHIIYNENKQSSVINKEYFF